MRIDHSRLSARDRLLFLAWRWVGQIWDPLHTLSGLRELPRFLASWREYRSLAGAEPIHIRDSYPQLHDRTSTHALDTHYMQANAWAMRRITAGKPARHIDVGSQPILSALLSAVVPVTFLDFRPLGLSVDGLTCVGGDILNLPFPDQSVASLSCLHVAEHIGLGRYGDPLNPEGTRLAARELSRVLAPEGRLLFAVPVGKPRLCFNAHRIHHADTVRGYFPDLELEEYSVVLDDGAYREWQSTDVTEDSAYALGMFAFTRPSKDSVQRELRVDCST